MSELAVTPFPIYNPEAPIAERLNFLNEYSDGRLQVVTCVPDIPGVKYWDALRPDTDQRPYASIDADRLEVRGSGSEVALSVRPVGEGEAMPLALDDVKYVRVDHPLSGHMPLGGQSMMPAAVDMFQGQLTLRWPDHSIEYGWKQRMADGVLSEYPGVGIVDTYDASVDPYDHDARPITLEEAKSRGRLDGRFLLTLLDDGGAVMTSRLWYANDREVRVRPPRQARQKPPFITGEGTLPIRDIGLLDLDKRATNETLLHAHLWRVKNRVGSAAAEVVRRPLGHMAANEVFLYAVSD
jgi:hypothetical protein